MRYFNAQRGTFLFIAAALFCLFPRLVSAEGEAEPASSSDSEGSSPLGTGLFSRFPIQVSISAQGGYDDNINTTHDQTQGSWFTNASVVLNYDFGSPRTKLNLSTTTGFTYYFDSTGNDYEPNLNLTLSLTHKASPRLTFAANSYTVYQTEPNFNYALGTNRRAGNYFLTHDELSAAFLWAPRFSTNSSYTFGAVHYDDSSFGFFEDRLENTISNEFRFLLYATTNVVAEYRFMAVTYEHISDRDSTTNFFLGGVDHVFNPRLSGSFRVGAEFRDYETSGQTDSPYFESTVNYLLGKNTAVSWTTRYSIEEGDVTFNQTRTTFRTGLEARHNLTARVSGSLQLYYTHDEYDSLVTPTFTSPAFSEDTFNAVLSLRYAVTRYLGVEAGFNVIDVSSGQPLREYSRNRVWGGLNLSF